MSLLADVEAEVKRPGGVCTVTTLGLDAQDADDLAGLLADPSVPSSAIARALGKRGHHIAMQSLQRHRRGDCRCAR